MRQTARAWALRWRSDAAQKHTIGLWLSPARSLEATAAAQRKCGVAATALTLPEQRAHAAERVTARDVRAALS